MSQNETTVQSKLLRGAHRTLTGLNPALESLLAAIVGLLVGALLMYMYGFDPNNSQTLLVPPHGAASFELGWFFQNARGRWEQDILASRIFQVKGKFTVQLVFRNQLKHAVIYDQDTKQTHIHDVWQGELTSNPVTIEVK